MSFSVGWSSILGVLKEDDHLGIYVGTEKFPKSFLIRGSGVDKVRSMTDGGPMETTEYPDSDPYLENPREFLQALTTAANLELVQEQDENQMYRALGNPPGLTESRFFKLNQAPEEHVGSRRPSSSTAVG